MSYREYFNIDPEYFPQVDKKIIDTQPDLWKKFYPHPSFINLIKATVDVLKRKQKLSIWVDGAYGTGKSHAVLTLKKLLESTPEETKEYFDKYQLDNYLCTELNAQKAEGKIIICHRYGSSDINSDTDLIVAIQEGIEEALAKAGIENSASASIKNSLITFFEQSENVQMFNIQAEGSAKALLGGDKAADILEKLKTYSDESLRTLINKIFKVDFVKNKFRMSAQDLCDWIREVISSNNLKELVFMWDEFSEFFENNVNHLTGFQGIAELSATAPFCLMIVTHKAEAYFSDNDMDKKKILDRFVPPVHISLPENIAFELMAQAMKISDDETIAAKWERSKGSLITRTNSSRDAVAKKIHLSDKDLTNVLPIHPYAALLLQHISVYYTSTARSMFNFIKNDEGEEVKAFQWFIDNYDISSHNPYISVDMLWSFFYDSGKSKLASGIRQILDCYTPKMEKTLIVDEQRVLKAILLLQAVSERMTGNKDIFLPNQANLTYAFEGTDLAFSAVKIAEKLLKDHVISRTPLTGNVYSYCCQASAGPEIDISETLKTAKSKTTEELSFMPGTDLRNTIELPASLKLRYSLSYATSTKIDAELKKANNPSEISNKIYAIATIARNAEEGKTIVNKVRDFYANNPGSSVVVIDSSNITLEESKYDEFCENYATALAIGSSDINKRKTYESYATEILQGWSKNIKNGAFYVYTKDCRDGDRAADARDLSAKLLSIDKTRYPKCPEGEFTNVVATMYDANPLAVGASCGINEETKGTYKSSNEITKLENALKGAWKVEDYWKNSYSYIATVKQDIEALIEKEFSKSDRISIAKIWEMLKAEPYGFMPCNLSAFLIGFLLKEYANGVYSYCDNLTTVPLTSDNLSNMIAEIIKNENTPDRRYKDKYIVTLTEEERAFNKATCLAFEIDEKLCVSITETRARIREQMKSFSFPIWLIEYVLPETGYKTSKKVVESLIENYCGIANNKNIDGDKSDNDIALSIGKLCIDNPGAADDLKSVLTKDNCKQGMIEYLKVYEGGKLPALAREIEDNGQFINFLQYKFSSDAANWVWNRDTVNAKIDEQITEYEIITTSNLLLARQNTYAETIHAWISKLNQIKISFASIRNYLGDEKAFIEMLYNLKKQGQLLDSQKKSFLELLKANTASFKGFMANQNELFMKAFEFYLDDLSVQDVANILDDDKYAFAGTFTMDSNTYTNKVSSAVKTYKSGIVSIALRRHWKELTGTEDPRDWSIKYSMPILAMVPSDESAVARKAFGTILSKNATDEAIAEAEDYISKMKYVNDLNNSAARDKAFRSAILVNYSELFDNLEDVKDYLKKHTSDSPFNWLNSTEVPARIRALANAKYRESGYDKAKRVIDDMSADQLKDYLKKLIEDNVIVGTEIIKSGN